MQISLAPNGAPRLYALVGYIPEPLGAFLNQLRRELVPGCQLLSHVTLLPPRLLTSPEPDIVQDLSEALSQLPALELEAGGVEMFPVTDVVYLDIKTGRRQLTDIHRHLNRGLLAFDEPFEYHPHVTLAQQMDPEAVAGVMERAAAAWNGWKGARRFAVEKLTFVRNVDPQSWTTVSEHPLQPASLLRTV